MKKLFFVLSMAWLAIVVTTFTPRPMPIASRFPSGASAFHPTSFSYASTDYITTQTLASAVTSNATQAARIFPAGPKTFQASMTVTSGSGSVTVTIQGSLDGTWFDDVATLSPTNTASDSISVAASAYVQWRSKTTSISGTGAAVTVTGAN